MKESKFTFAMAIVLALLGYFDGGTSGVIGYIMAFGFGLTSSICRAIERNGKEL